MIFRYKWFIFGILICLWCVDEKGFELLVMYDLGDKGQAK